MIVAVMQPYLFPYLGYFQLAFSADHFVFLDDVNFIKKGFINRNKILCKAGVLEFTIPVRKISQNRFINEHSYTGDFSNFLSNLRHHYSRSPYFKDVFSLVEKWILDPELNVAKKNVMCIADIFSYLGVDFSYSYSSSVPRLGTSGQQRILEICKFYNAGQYHNAIGGIEIYKKKFFIEENIDIYFINGFFKNYKQFSNNRFAAGLSIIDVMMFNSKDEIRLMLQDYNLEAAL